MEIAKWIYGLIVSVVMFCFFCLFLDVFCLIAFGGWQPLLGKWPIFSGTISLAYFGDPWKVFVLILGLAGTARIMLGKKIPPVLEIVFDNLQGNSRKDESSIEEGNDIE